MTSTSAGYNFRPGGGSGTKNTCGLTAVSDISGTDPQLGALKDNGGPGVLTMLPTSTSPVLRAAVSCFPSVATTDERGFFRPASDCTIGAVEPVAAIKSPTGGSLVANGHVTYEMAAHYNNGAVAPGELTVIDVPDSKFVAGSQILTPTGPSIGVFTCSVGVCTNSVWTSPSADYTFTADVTLVAGAVAGDRATNTVNVSKSGTVVATDSTTSTVGLTLTVTAPTPVSVGGPVNSTGSLKVAAGAAINSSTVTLVPGSNTVTAGATLTATGPSVGVFTCSTVTCTNTLGALVANTVYTFSGSSVVDSGARAGDIAVTGLSTLVTGTPVLAQQLAASSSIAAVTPGAPTLNTIQPGNASLTLPFTEGTTGGADLTTYEYSTDNGVTWVTRATGSTESPIVVTTRSDNGAPLVNGTAYQVRIRAVNSVGAGTTSNMLNGTPLAVPGAPTLVSLAAGSAGTSLSAVFTAGDPGGSPITNYQYSTDGGATWKVRASGTTASPISITTVSSSGSTLAAGTTYDVKIRAVNASGAGPESNQLSAEPGIPTTPNPPLASLNGTTVTLYPTSPATSGSVVSYTLVAVGDPSKTCVVTLPAESCTIPGLTFGSTYTFTATATNARGTSAASAASNSVTVQNPALIPTFDTPVPTTTGFTVNMTNYDAAFTYALSATVGSVSRAGAALAVTGLAPGQLSVVTVGTSRTDYDSGSANVSARASNAALTPTFGVVTSTADGFTVPISNYDANFGWSASAPPGGTAGVSPGTGVLTVTGVAPGGTFVSTVTTARAGYVDGSAPVSGTALNAARTPTFDAVTRTVGGFSAQISNFDAAWTWDVASVSAGSATISPAGLVEVTGLTPNQESTVTVATTRAGYLPGSAPVTGNAADVPGAPGTPTLTTNGMTSQQVSWTAPSNGGSVVTGYTLDISSDGGTVWTPNPVGCAALGTAVTCTATALTPSTAYLYRVRATNAVGVGPNSGVGGPFTTDAAPLPARTPTFDAVTRTVGGFSAQISNFDAAWTWDVASVSAGSATISPAGLVEVTGLTPNQESTVTVATTRAGYLPGSAPVTGNAADVPGAPGTPTLTTNGMTSQQVSWTAPANGGSVVTGYTLDISSDGGTVWTPNPVGCAALGTAVTCTATALTPSTAYLYRVRATNAVGVGPNSGVGGPFITDAGPLPARTPTFDAVTRMAGGFSAQISNFDPAWNWFVGSVSAGSATISPAGLVEVTGLTPGQESTVAIDTTRAGYLPGSAPVTGNAADVPGAPTALVATPGAGFGQVAFTPPVSNGGLAITNYMYQADGGPWTALSPAATGSPVTIPGLSNLVVHTILLRAVNGVGPGAQSQPVNVRPTTVPPAPPTGPTVTGSGPIGNRTLNLAPPPYASVNGYSVVYKKTVDEGNPTIKWGVYAMKRVGGWATGAAPAQVRMDVAPANCGATNLGAGFDWCPMPYQALASGTQYSFKTMAQYTNPSTGANTYGVYSPITRIVIP